MFEPGWKYLEQVSTYLRAVRQGANPIVAMKGPVFEIITEGVVHDRSHPPGIPVSSPTSTKVNASTATYLLPFTKEGFAELAARVTDLENEFDAIVIANNQA